MFTSKLACPSYDRLSVLRRSLSFIYYLRDGRDNSSAVFGRNSFRSLDLILAFIVWVTLGPSRRQQSSFSFMRRNGHER
jgi:hypothetical protein